MVGVVVGVVVGEVVDGAGADVDGGADVGGPALSDPGIDGGGGACDGGGGSSMTPDTSALDGGADAGTRPAEDGGTAGALVVAVGVVSRRGLETLSGRPVSAVTLANPSTKARTPAAAIANLRFGDVPRFSALGRVRPRTRHDWLFVREHLAHGCGGNRHAGSLPQAFGA